MNSSAFPGAASDGGLVLCLNFAAWAQRVFGSGESAWFDATLLLAHGRQAQQALRADWVLLPLREWAEAWWQARHGAGEASAAPLRRLKARLADGGLRSALADTLRALQSVTGASARLALQIDGGASWLAWAGAAETDDDDAEEALVHVAALLHVLSGSGIEAVVVLQQGALPDDPSSHFEALTNAAHHHGWRCALCAGALAEAVDGFDAVATRAPAAGQGAWLAGDDWTDPAVARGAPFIVATVPADAAPDTVLARVARWRGRA